MVQNHGEVVGDIAVVTDWNRTSPDGLAAWLLSYSIRGGWVGLLLLVFFFLMFIDCPFLSSAFCCVMCSRLSCLFFSAPVSVALSVFYPRLSFTSYSPLSCPFLHLPVPSTLSCPLLFFLLSNLYYSLSCCTLSTIFCLSILYSDLVSPFRLANQCHSFPCFYLNRLSGSCPFYLYVLSPPGLSMFFLPLPALVLSCLSIPSFPGLSKSFYHCLSFPLLSSPLPALPYPYSPLSLGCG